MSLAVFSFYQILDFLQIFSMKCRNILCTGKFDRHNFIGREKRRVERASFPAILKYVVFFGKNNIAASGWQT